ncbi:PPC domain-containing DNA-binding protein [Paracoccus aestuariivivens]|uniref:DUF296 domain-containing protein n=1 Tax=Paracoccus aestuariivivens TaxID=1820333 RepID=A0A6L6JCJ5_9RHOB|nr:PPC domain-containing DNA-binding protein [Paracoccus aestuariivivens]MTH79913.1 DUF296 domain-containing protein [Paracoccus aestuariivivens]
MRSKVLHNAAGQRTYALIFESGDEVMSCLQEFAKAKGLTAASFKAIGAFETATLAFFDWSTKTYLPIRVEEQTEVASFTGDIAQGPDKQPVVHVHAVLGRRDGSALAGHLKEAKVRPTLEVILIESPQHLRKHQDTETGLALIRID